MGCACGRLSGVSWLRVELKWVAVTLPLDAQIVVAVVEGLVVVDQLVALVVGRIVAEVELERMDSKPPVLAARLVRMGSTVFSSSGIGLLGVVVR